MQEKGLSLIVAATPEGVIGSNNGLPWNIPSELKRFNKLTAGHPIIMGRKSWESINGRYRPFSAHTNIVMTRHTAFSASRAVVVNSIERACITARKAAGAGEIFVVGGAEIYRQFFPLVDKVYITRVYASVVGDMYFRHFAQSEEGWELLEASRRERGNPHDLYLTSFEVYERISSS